MQLFEALPSVLCVWAQSHLTLKSHRLQPTSLLCSWNFPGKNTGVGCHFLLQGIFPTQGSKPCLSCIGKWILYHCATVNLLSVIEVKREERKITKLNSAQILTFLSWIQLHSVSFYFIYLSMTLNTSVSYVSMFEIKRYLVISSYIICLA